MQRGRQVITTVAILGLGYLLGSLQVLHLPLLFAQPAETLSEEAKKKIEAAYDALRSARDTLQVEGLHKQITKSINTYGILAGGIDSEKDLEDGKGVDPETFAALYAGDAVESVAVDLSHDEEGRLTYKNKVLRIYPISKLKRIHDRQQQMIEPGATPKK